MSTEQRCYGRWCGCEMGADKGGRVISLDSAYARVCVCVRACVRLVMVVCVVWCGVVWCGVVWCGVVWCGVVWCGVVWCGACVYIYGNAFIRSLKCYGFLSQLP